MVKNIVYLKDSIGQPYVGVKFSPYEMKSVLDIWASLFNGDEEFSKLLTFTNNRNKRDGESYHITLINAMEWKVILADKPKSEIDSVFYHLIDDIVFEGIGKAEKDGNEAHFVVVSSIKLNAIRTLFNLELKDLHITLGFDRKDVHGISKGLDTLIKELPKDEDAQ